MYVLRSSVTGEQVSAWYWTWDDAAMARGHSELLEIVEDNTYPIPRDLDMSLKARAERWGKPFDPHGSSRRQ